MSLSKKGNIQFIKAKYIEDFEVVVGKKVVNAFPVHIHEKYCIGIIEKGNALLLHKNREVGLCSGYIYFINPKEPHQIKPVDQEGFDHVVLCFGINFINNYLSKMENAALNFKNSIIHNNKIWSSIILFYSKLNKISFYIDVEYELIKIFSEMYQYFSFSKVDSINEKEKANSMLKVCDYIKENSKENLSLQEMASIVGLSKFHFLRIFKGEIGISPYDYQIQHKIKLARQMLLESRPSPYVTTELGFSDQSHFTKFFKRNTGVTPFQFVKMNKEVSFL